MEINWPQWFSHPCSCLRPSLIIGNPPEKGFDTRLRMIKHRRQRNPRSNPSWASSWAQRHMPLWKHSTPQSSHRTRRLMGRWKTATNSSSGACVQCVWLRERRLRGCVRATAAGISLSLSLSGVVIAGESEWPQIETKWNPDTWWGKKLRFL